MIRIRKPNKDSSNNKMDKEINYRPLSYDKILENKKNAKDPLAKALWLLVLSKTYRYGKGL